MCSVRTTTAAKCKIKKKKMTKVKHIQNDLGNISLSVSLLLLLFSRIFKSIFIFELLPLAMGNEKYRTDKIKNPFPK